MYRDPPTDAFEPTVLTVSELTGQIKELLEEGLPAVWVAGEISNMSRPQSGHVYLTLKDDRAQIRAVLWRSTALQLRFALADGLDVICRGTIDVYAPRGSYQLVIRQIEPQGEGALQLALRQLKAKLAAEGLFDENRKRPLPRYPRRVAFVTSPTGAAIRDFLEVIGRRWRGLDVLVIPARVQGEGAAAEIAAGIRAANRLAHRPDVLVVGRGGGSLEDLWCFNEEVVVRAIVASEIPVVSAVGHEIDVTLADFAADRRALTPSEAAELVVPDREELLLRLDSNRQRLAAVLVRPARPGSVPAGLPGCQSHLPAATGSGPRTGSPRGRTADAGGTGDPEPPGAWPRSAWPVSRAGWHHSVPWPCWAAATA